MAESRDGFDKFLDKVKAAGFDVQTAPQVTRADLAARNEAHLRQHAGDVRWQVTLARARAELLDRALSASARHPVYVDSLWKDGHQALQKALSTCGAAWDVVVDMDIVGLRCFGIISLIPLSREVKQAARADLDALKWGRATALRVLQATHDCLGGPLDLRSSDLPKMKL